MMTGLLLRSAMVSGWPGLEVKAFEADCVTKLNALRIERLAPDVLLCIFNGSAGCIHISEPAETLHFGLLELEQDGNTPTPAWQVTLRYLESSDNHRIGEQIKDDKGHDDLKVKAAMRKDAQGQATRVLDIMGTAGTLSLLETKLRDTGTLAQGAKLSPAGFAIQMVEAAIQQEFKKAATSPAAQTMQARRATNAGADKRQLRVADLIRQGKEN
jgi:hypothetical protein